MMKHLTDQEIDNILKNKNKDFRDMYIRGYDFANKDLSNANFTNTLIIKCNFADSILSRSDFTDAIIVDCCFDRATIENAKIVQCDFTLVDLAEATPSGIGFTLSAVVDTNFRDESEG